MNILIPMAGAGSRFVKEGYAKHKPVIPVTDRRSGENPNGCGGNSRFARSWEFKNYLC
jgi:hypothetical protein